MLYSKDIQFSIIFIISFDKILVSPSAAGGKSDEWFEAFFDACESLGCRIDYLATHDYHGEADTVMDRLEDLYNRPVLNFF